MVDDLVASSQAPPARLTLWDSTAAGNSVLVLIVDNPADYGDAPIALERRAGQISFHSDWIAARLRTQSLQPPAVPAGDALPLRGRARPLDGNTNSIWCSGTDPTRHRANDPGPHGELIPTSNSDYGHAASPDSEVS